MPRATKDDDPVKNLVINIWPTSGVSSSGRFFFCLELGTPLNSGRNMPLPIINKITFANYTDEIL